MPSFPVVSTDVRVASAHLSATTGDGFLFRTKLCITFEDPQLPEIADAMLGRCRVEVQKIFQGLLSAGRCPLREEELARRLRVRLSGARPAIIAIEIVAPFTIVDRSESGIHPMSDMVPVPREDPAPRQRDALGTPNPQSRQNHSLQTPPPRRRVSTLKGGVVVAPATPPPQSGIAPRREADEAARTIGSEDAPLRWLRRRSSIRARREPTDIRVSMRDATARLLFAVLLSLDHVSFDLMGVIDGRTDPVLVSRLSGECAAAASEMLLTGLHKAGHSEASAEVLLEQLCVQIWGEFRVSPVYLARYRNATNPVDVLAASTAAVLKGQSPHEIHSVIHLVAEAVQQELHAIAKQIDTAA